MKKTAAAALVLLGALLAGCSKTETPAPAAATPAPAVVTKIVVGLDDNFPPMGFRDEKNELVGFDIDMAKEAAKRLALGRFVARGVGKGCGSRWAPDH